MAEDSESAASSPEITQRLAELTDLFRRRLLDDREKQRAFDALYRELAQARAIADGQYLVPLMRRLINVIDRLAADSGELARSIAEELTGILAIYEVEEIKAESAAFDPRIQEVAAVLDTADPGQDGLIASVRRSGWRLGTHVLRPMLVDVGRCPDRGRES